MCWCCDDGLEVGIGLVLIPFVEPSWPHCMPCVDGKGAAEEVIVVMLLGGSLWVFQGAKGTEWSFA